MVCMSAYPPVLLKSIQQDKLSEKARELCQWIMKLEVMRETLRHNKSDHTADK